MKKNENFLYAFSNESKRKLDKLSRFFYTLLFSGKSMAQRKKIISLLSSYVILFFVATEFATLSAQSTNETDLQALLEIKNHIQRDPFQILNSWNLSVHFCNWQGITCGLRHKRVIVLNISSLHLVGTLSPSVGNLSFLQEINLQGNSFYGIIPPEVGRLFRLRNLRLANNSFQEQLPANLTGCKNLQIIDLRGNHLSERIPDELGTLSSLYALSLSRNNFTGYIPPALGNISTLQILSLSRNSLSGNIPPDLGKLYNLRVLELSSNMLSGAFPGEIYNISSIQIFSITNNLLTGHFPDTLGLTLPNITLFLADLNHFTGSIPSTLANASQLVKISIGDNMLTGPIPRNLGSLQHLQVLHFGHNPLGTDNANDIGFIATLTNCTNLQILSLSRIEIGGVLPVAIANLSRNLASFWLNDNYITGSLPEGVGELVGLSYFDVRGNTLSNRIPLSIGKIINMQELYLSENNFSGEIPPSIGDISGLQILELDENMLTGSIPVSLSNCTDLQGLNLGYNHLNGTLPEEIFSLTSLSLWLNLAQNKFTGSLPSDVGNLQNLVSLVVYESGLSGEIPDSIGGCEMLENLEMQGNSMEGLIPSSMGKLTSVQVIDLSRNNLSGPIPTSLEKLSFVSTLNLSFNMLEGEVPSNGVFKNASVLSILGNTKLCGGILSLNLPTCPKASKRHGKLSTPIIVVLAVSIPLALVLLLGCIYRVSRTRSARRVPSSTSGYTGEGLKISYAEIVNSTNGFSSDNLIGEGKHGSVYHGVLKPDEKIVAFKVLKLQTKGAHKSFLAECEALRSIRHRNLVKIITSCSSIDFKGNDFKALIFEYVPNGSLEAWLHQNPSVNTSEKKLDILQRLNIAIDIASALDYLHNHHETPIIHCDIKPSNILIGDDLRALVSDFGLAKFLETAKDGPVSKESSSIGIRGTVGYVAPEYGMGGNISAKGDLYSYGILLLEMFTGKRPTDTMFTEDFGLHIYVKAALPHRVADIIDPQLLKVEENETNKSNRISRRMESCCSSILSIGVSCSAEMHKERMDIKDALNELQDIRKELG